MQPATLIPEVTTSISSSPIQNTSNSTLYNELNSASSNECNGSGALSLSN